MGNLLHVKSGEDDLLTRTQMFFIVICIYHH